MLTRIPAAAAIALAVLFFGTSPAAAEPDPPVDVSPAPGGVNVDTHAKDDPQGTPEAVPVPGADRTVGVGNKKRTCTFDGQEMECTSASGVWNQERGCWVQRMSPQPPTSNTWWDGHRDGAIYTCTPPFSGGGQRMGVPGLLPSRFWAPDAGAAGAPATVDPVVLAEEAIERMNLVNPRVGATPLGTGKPGVVGIETWLWLANDGPTAFGPITRTATAGAVSVTATAEVSKVVWDMGNGDEVTCRTPGTEWSRSFGQRMDSPTCGYTYLTDSGDARGDAYQVTATTHWRVEWDGAGQSGVIEFTLTGPSRDMPIVELQALRTS